VLETDGEVLRAIGVAALQAHSNLVVVTALDADGAGAQLHAQAVTGREVDGKGMILQVPDFHLGVGETYRNEQSQRSKQGENRAHGYTSFV
jgi:hypothetical protein